MIIDIINNNDAFKVEAGDVIRGKSGDVWIVIKNVERADYRWLNIKSGMFSNIRYNDIRDLIRKEFEPDLLFYGVSENFKVIKSDNLKLTLK